MERIKLLNGVMKIRRKFYEDKKEILSVEFSSETTLATTRGTYAIKDVVIWLMCCVPVIGFICRVMYSVHEIN